MAVLGLVVVCLVSIEVDSRAQEPDDRFRTGLSGQGLQGLIAVPSASAMNVGDAYIGLNTWPNTGVFAGRGEFDQWNFNFSLGLFSRLVVGGRGTEARPVDGGRHLGRDLAANARLLILYEGRLVPAVAVGVQDVGGTAVNFQARYAVATKTLGRRVRLTAGYGIGPDVLEGAFGGVELAPSRYVQLLADYNTNRISTGVRAFPVPQRYRDAGYPDVQADLMWSEEGGVSWGLSLRSPIDPVRAVRERKPESAPIVRGSSGFGSDRELVNNLQASLVAVGLENVRVSCSEECARLSVQYENRRYHRNEFDALARVYQILAADVSDRVDEVGVSVLKAGVAVFEVTVRSENLPRLANRTVNAIAERPRFEVESSAIDGVATSIENRSRWKLDVVPVPGLETVLYTERAVAMARVYALPAASVQVLPGTVLTAAATLPITETPNFPGFMPHTHVHRALGHVAIRLPFVKSGITQFSAGRFSELFYGWINDTAVMGWGGRVLFGGKVGIQRFRLNRIDRLYAVGRVRYLLPALDTRLTLQAGQFFDKDRGYTVDLARFFGDTEIGLFLRKTNAGALAGIRITLPLSPIKDMKPYRVRIRPPSRWDYEQRTLILDDRNYLVTDIARQVWTGHEVESVYLNRDRMNEASFLEYFSQ